MNRNHPTPVTRTLKLQPDCVRPRGDRSGLYRPLPADPDGCDVPPSTATVGSTRKRWTEGASWRGRTAPASASSAGIRSTTLAAFPSWPVRWRKSGPMPWYSTAKSPCSMSSSSPASACSATPTPRGSAPLPCRGSGRQAPRAGVAGDREAVGCQSTRDVARHTVEHRWGSGPTRLETGAKVWSASPYTRCPPLASHHLPGGMTVVDPKEP